MSLPVPVIDRLFQRLAATYGAAWDRSLGSAPMADVKAAWGHELAGFGDKLHAIAWALDNLPERVPNALEFRGMCRAAPALVVPKLPEPKADPACVQAALESLTRPTLHSAPDGAAWAFRILEKHAAGAKRFAPITLRMAREVVESEGVST